MLFSVGAKTSPLLSPFSTLPSLLSAFSSSSTPLSLLNLKPPPSPSSSSSSSSSYSLLRMASNNPTPSSPSTNDTNKTTSPPSYIPPSNVIDFLILCHRLKTTKRAGWVNREVQNPESIADHMYLMSIMGLISNVPGLDRDKLVKMALVHDMAEAIVGDITPSDGVPKAEKSRREREAMDHMCNLLGGGAIAKEVYDLWMEYEENSSVEAKLVKDFDKVEMILQAWEYEKGQGKDLEEFFQSTAGKFQTEIGKAWAREIVTRRSN